MINTNIKKGDNFKVKVINKGRDGDAIAKIEGLVIIIKNKELQIGDEIKIIITKVLNKYVFAEVQKNGYQT